MLLCESPPNVELPKRRELTDQKKPAINSVRAGKYSNTMVVKIATIKPRGRRAISVSRQGQSLLANTGS